MGWFEDALEDLSDTINKPGRMFDDFIKELDGEAQADRDRKNKKKEKKEQKEYDDAAAKAAKEKTERDIALAEEQFKIEQEDAFDKADDIEKQAKEIDLHATQQESLLAQSLSGNFDQIGSSIEDYQLAKQQAKVSQEVQEGSLRAAIGMSGTREGSTREKVIVQNTEQFQQALRQSDRSSKGTVDYNLANIFQNLEGNKNSLEQARRQANEAIEDATKLRDDYTAGTPIEDGKENAFGIKGFTIGNSGRTEGGGRAWNLFQQQINNRRKDSESDIDLASLASQFKQNAYDREIERSRFTWEDGFVNIFNIASGGLGMASSISNLSKFMPSFNFGKIASNVKTKFRDDFIR